MVCPRTTDRYYRNAWKIDLNSTELNYLTNAVFLRELRALLWIDPFLNRGVRDEGWSCREHAFVVASLAAMRGRTATVLHGACGFVRVTQDGESRTGREVNPHTWLDFAHGEVCDLSVKLAGTTGFIWDHWEKAVLVAGQFLPVGETHFASFHNVGSFNNAFNMATNAEHGQFALYFPQKREPFSVEIVGRAMNWCNSPLTVRLKNLFAGRTDLYCKAVLYLDDLIEERCEPLGEEMPQMIRWRRIAARPGNGRVELASKIN